MASVLAAGVSSGGLWAAGTILGVILIGTLWPTLAIGGLRGSLSFGRRRAREGEPVRVSLNLTNRRHWPVWAIACESGLSRDARAGVGFH